MRLNGERLETTPGRIFFNDVLPDEMGFYNEVIDRKALGRLVDDLYRRFGSTRTAEVLDEIKTLGFQYADPLRDDVGITDIAMPPEKEELYREGRAAGRESGGAAPPRPARPTKSGTSGSATSGPGPRTK